jgi:hypothetical protein
VKGQESRNTIKSLGEISVACMLMGVAVYVVKEKITGLFSVHVELATLVLCGVVSYSAFAFLRRAEEVQPLFRALTSLGAKYLPRRS